MIPILLEVCVDDAEGLDAAIRGGADRIELCSALALGGLTPPPGLMRVAAQAPVPVYAMIRPRAGDFVFGEADVAVMKRDIEAARDAGLAGVVLGASRNDDRLDAALLRRLVRRAGGLGLTLHRAFDVVPDVIEAVETAVDLGFERILTSGGAVSAVEGADRLRATNAAARGRITIMPGSGVTADNIDALRRIMPLTEVHASCSEPIPERDGAARASNHDEREHDVTRKPVPTFRHHALRFDMPDRYRTSAVAVQRLKAACNAQAG